MWYRYGRVCGYHFRRSQSGMERYTIQAHRRMHMGVDGREGTHQRQLENFIMARVVDADFVFLVDVRWPLVVRCGTDAGRMARTPRRVCAAPAHALAPNPCARHYDCPPARHRMQRAGCFAVGMRFWCLGVLVRQRLVGRVRWSGPTRACGQGVGGLPLPPYGTWCRMWGLRVSTSVTQRPAPPGGQTGTAWPRGKRHSLMASIAARRLLAHTVRPLVDWAVLVLVCRCRLTSVLVRSLPTRACRYGILPRHVASDVGAQAFLIGAPKA